MPKKKVTKTTPAKQPVKSKSAASPKTTHVETAPVVAAPVDTVPIEETKTEIEDAPPSLTDAFSNLLGQLSSLRSQLTSVTGQVRALQKRADRELKSAHKSNKKRSRRSGNRAPSGFVKPTKISSELAAFLGKPKGTEMARTEVTREINGYIREHSLQDPANGRRILADTKLKKLLKLKSNDELTYFNLQRYMSPHFAKKNQVVADTSN